MKKIIHFTEHFTTIKKILDGKSLKLAYSWEEFYLGNKRISSAVHPMVCFSEFSFAELENKPITYGEYGVAFSENWVQKKKIHPVIYIDNNSIVANSLATLLQARRNKEENSSLPKHLKSPIMTIKCFTKNSKGYNSYLKLEDFDFRSENEWRYVPTKKQIGGGLISQSRSKVKTDDDKEKYNNKLLKYWLKFEINDVEKIFVANQTQIDTIHDQFRINKSKIEITNWKYVNIKKKS